MPYSQRIEWTYNHASERRATSYEKGHPRLGSVLEAQSSNSELKKNAPGF